MKPYTFIRMIGISLLLQSCEFNCSVGKKDEEIEKPKTLNGRIKNDIQLETNGVKIEKAYLVFEDGMKVPEDNVVDFSKKIKMYVFIDSGWTVIDGKVKLGASEKITALGKTLLDEKDLFNELSDGVSPEDANVISLSATINLKKEVQPLTTFQVSFKIWDKNSEAFITGSYKLFSK